MDAKLLARRTFTYQDSVGTPPVIIVDETLAKLAWPGENPVGKQLQLAPRASRTPSPRWWAWWSPCGSTT